VNPSDHPAPGKETPRRIWLRELGAVWRAGWRNFLRRWWILGLNVVFGVAIIYLQNGQDRVWLAHLQSENDFVQAIAKGASKWGDWPGWAALGCSIWVFGAARKKTFWREAGLACLLATLMAGVTINCFRPTLGRPRPYTEIPDGLYGPHLSTRYHAFMSGHTAASFAAATALAIAAPPVGIPTLGGATVVGWSRMQLGKHHPSDVLVGGVTGILWGWCFGRAVSRRGRK
jgi:undecaprenyl-diphosphatase